MRLAVTRVQFACDWQLLGNSLNATGFQSHAIYACDWRPVQCKTVSLFESTRPEQLFELKNEEIIKKI
jgi:hypothetical protein